MPALRVKVGRRGRWTRSEAEDEEIVDAEYTEEKRDGEAS